MSDLTEVSLLKLANRLNEIEIQRQQISLKNIDNEHKMKILNEEYDEIVYELWNRIPSLKDDANIQPKKKIKKGNKR